MHMFMHIMHECSKLLDFHSLCVRAHMWCVFVGLNVYDLYMFVCFYTPQALPWVHLCACLDPYLHCAWLFVLPVFMIVQRRIQCCWLFCCQLFRMQPPPLLTLPLMGDRRWKSSSHPADAFRFWWVFLFSSQIEKSCRTGSFIDDREDLPLLSLQCLYSDFSPPHYIFSLQQQGWRERRKAEEKQRWWFALTMKQMLRRL